MFKRPLSRFDRFFPVIIHFKAKNTMVKPTIAARTILAVAKQAVFRFMFRRTIDLVLQARRKVDENATRNRQQSGNSIANAGQIKTAIDYIGELDAVVFSQKGPKVQLVFFERWPR
jgi:hypothetical protein